MYIETDRENHHSTTEVRKTCDWKYQKFIEEALERNGGYCPRKHEHTEDNRCMCKEFHEQKNGFCSCGLYEKIVHLVAD